RPSSTAATATSLPGAGALPSDVRTAIETGTVSRTRYVVRPEVTLTVSSWARQPTRISAMPSLNAGRPRSTIAVGWIPPTRPRTTRTETNTLGAYAPRSGTSTQGSLPDTGLTHASRPPSRSTVISAVAPRTGIRT